MVYCGKPSKSCRPCRERNIKCDKKRSSCGQCIRAQLDCPGYPDPKQLVFRDETNTILQKQILRDSSSTWGTFVTNKSDDNSNSLCTSVSTSSSELVETRSQPPSTAISIPPSIEFPLVYHAKNIFVCHHVFGAPDSPLPPFSYLRSCFPPSPSDVFLTSAMQAVCLAYLATRVRADRVDIFGEGERIYGVALRALSRALEVDKGLQGDARGTNRTVAVNGDGKANVLGQNGNAIVLTALLLDLFECLSNTVHSNKATILGSWDGNETPSNLPSIIMPTFRTLDTARPHKRKRTHVHLQGALTILSTRGPNQFHDRISLSLFRSLASSLLPLCLSQYTEVPSEFLKLRAQAAKFIGEEDIEWRVDSLMIKLMALRIRISEGRVRNLEALIDIAAMERQFNIIREELVIDLTVEELGRNLNEGKSDPEVQESDSDRILGLRLPRPDFDLRRKEKLCFIREKLDHIRDITANISTGRPL